MTIREVTFVYPLLNSLSQSRGIEPDKKQLVDGIIGKIQTILNKYNAQLAALVNIHGEDRLNGNGKRIRTKEQLAAYQQAVAVYKSGAVNVVLLPAERDLFELLLWQALLGGYEDFPGV